MNQRVAKKLRRLCYSTSMGDAASAQKRYQRLKADWVAVPSNQRHKLLQSLERAAGAMQGMLAKAAEAGRQASASERAA